MKKVFLWFLFAALGVSLAGCGGRDILVETTGSDNQVETTVQTAAQDGNSGDDENTIYEEVTDDQTNVTPGNRPVKISEDFPHLYSIDDLKSKDATKDLYFTDLNKQVEPKNVLVLVFNYNNGEFDPDDEWIETAWGDYIFGHGTIPEKTASINDFYKEMSGGKFYLSPVLLGDNKTGVYSIRLDKDYSDQQFVHPEYEFFDFSYDLALVMSELAENGLDIERYTIPGIDGSNYQRILMDNWNAPQSERTKERFSLDGIICVYPPINMESTDLTPVAFDFEHFGLYAHVNHDSSFGTIAHEIGHLLGAVDIYKYNYVYNDLMSYGYDPENEYSVSHVDPYYKMIWGWTEVKYADKNGTTILSPAYSKDYAPILIPTEDPNQYFLIENRRKGGFDNYLEADRETYYEGVAIWRVDKLALEKIYTKERKGLSLEAVLNFVGEEFDLQIYKDFENVDTTGLKDTGMHISYAADVEEAAVIQISGLSE